MFIERIWYQRLTFQVVFKLELHKIFTTQQAITCSMLTIETLEKGVKYVQS